MPGDRITTSTPVTASASLSTTVLDTRQGLPAALDLKTLHVRYPWHWFAPVPLSRFAKTIEDQTIRWMHDLGLLKDTDTLQQVWAMEPRHYAGYSHSMASFDHALVYCKYITMWLLWDDHCVEPASTYTPDLADAIAALAGESLPAHRRDTAYARAFADIGNEYQRLGASLGWRRRFAGKMQEWARHAIAEQRVRKAGNPAGRSLQEALQLRAVTVGIRPNSLPLERAVGIELPETILVHTEYTSLIDQAALVCCLINDLVGVPKDLHQGQHDSNLVLFHQHVHRCPLAISCAEIIRIHDAAVDDYDRLALRLLQAAPSGFRERIATFIEHLRYMDTGFGFWHRDCTRYQRWLAVTDNQALRVAIGARQASADDWRPSSSGPHH